MKLPLRRAIDATGATVLDIQAAPPWLRVATDTRALQRGDTFVALRGERYDGHAFTAEAVRRGAAALIVDDAAARVEGVATLVVAESLTAYMRLAGLARQLFDGVVVGITGSGGKTTTRVLLEQLARTHYGDRVLAPPANENNEIGVSRLLLSAEGHDVAIVEMGARGFGDVAALVEIARPQIGVLTNIGEAHLEIMGSRERVAETKWGLFSQGARALLNAADEQSRARAGALPQPPHWFTALDALQPAPYPELERLTAVLGDRWIMHRDARAMLRREAEIRLPGRHNRANLAAALAAALEIGVPFERLAAAIGGLMLPEGRYAQISAGGLRFIYDAYNANASGMLAALDAFAGEAAARRIAVLGSMAELGAESEALHERVGAHAAATVDVLVVSGDFAPALARGARDAGLARSQIVAVDGNVAAAAWLRRNARGDDLILLKGSRRYRLEEIVAELQR